MSSSLVQEQKARNADYEAQVLRLRGEVSAQTHSMDTLDRGRGLVTSNYMYTGVWPPD